MTKTRPTPQPTHKKLPRLPKAYRTTSDWLNGMMHPVYIVEDTITDYPVAVIPCHTPAQARRIVGAAKFLTMSEDEQVERAAEAISDSKFREGIFHLLAEELKNEYRQYARAVLRAMGMGGGK